MFVKPNDVPHCFALTCKLKWDFDYNSSCFQKVGVVKRSCCNQNLISVCTLKQSSGGTSFGFTNIKSNWNMSRFDWKCSPVHKEGLNQSKWTFFTWITEGARYVFPRVDEWVTQHAYVHSLHFVMFLLYFIFFYALCSVLLWAGTSLFYPYNSGLFH